MEVVNALGEDKQNPFIEPPSYRLESPMKEISNKETYWQQDKKKWVYSFFCTFADAVEKTFMKTSAPNSKLDNWETIVITL